MKTNLTLILDAAHGSNVSGKRSPDGMFLEYQFSRKIISIVQEKLSNLDEIVIVETAPTELEPGLHDRVRIANRQASPALFVSVHANAAGSDGKWHDAKGFEIYTSIGDTPADDYASALFEKFVKAFPDFKVRKDTSDGDPDREANFYVLKNTRMPAVLIETGFQDNRSDVETMSDEEFQELYAQVIAESVIEYAVSVGVDIKIGYAPEERSPADTSSESPGETGENAKPAQAE